MNHNTRLFISCVSEEFGTYRQVLRRHLARADCEVKLQEEFRQTPVDTIEKLDGYIRGCAAVIHLVGEGSGAVANPQAVESAGLIADLILMSSKQDQLARRIIGFPARMH